MLLVPERRRSRRLSGTIRAERAQRADQSTQPRQALKKRFDRSWHPARDAESQQVDVANEPAAGEEDDPENALCCAGPPAVVEELLLEPHHQLVRPLELTRPNGETSQHQGDAAGSRDWSADKSEGDQDEAENADSNAVDSQLPLVLPDLAPPAPAIFLGFDEDVMVMLVFVLRNAASGSMRNLTGTWQGHHG